MEIRKATQNDIDYIEKIYEAIHDKEEKGLTTIGWIRNTYPTRKTAEDGLVHGDLFVMEDEDIQVTESMQAPETRERELRPLRMIGDNYEKIVLSMDRSFINSYDGIKSLNLIDWLLSE